jgi:putative hemolysin
MPAFLSVEILIILLLILLNGIFAMSEIAIVSSRRVRLQQRAEAGDRAAEAALALVDAPGRFLSTVQIGITAIGILAGAFGGAAVAQQLAGVIASIAVLAPHAELLGIGIVVLMITYLSLVLGELAPKRLALVNPERVACFVARPMRALARLASPAVRLLDRSTNAILALLRVQPPSDPPVTEEEIRILIRQGTAAGVFVQQEREMVEAVFQLADARAEHVMVPRSQIVWLDATDPPARHWETIAGSGHSQYPVHGESVDDVLGIVAVKDIFARLAAGTPLDQITVTELVTEPLYIPKTLRAFEILERFRQEKRHLAIVLDEFGGVAGLVTLNDIAEGIFGSVATATPEPAIVRRDDGAYLVDGLVDIDRFLKTFHLDRSLDDTGEPIETAAGLALAAFGRLPRVGERTQWNGLEIEVVQMEGHRIARLAVWVGAKEMTP